MRRLWPGRYLVEKFICRCLWLSDCCRERAREIGQIEILFGEVEKAVSVMRGGGDTGSGLMNG